MKYFSVFSGIEAASIAAKSLGWTAQGFSEIEPFPCAVLQHHYPEVTNYGDIRNIKGEQFRGKVDVYVGGSPCQNFSVAGNREGLDGESSGLAREYLRLLGEIHPNWFVWENVPGCLSTNKGRDFAAIVREMEKLGYGVSGRILDAQYFGVPQRRRRVFLVGSLGDWRPSFAVLFEPESVSGNPPTRRKAGEDPSSKIAKCLTAHGRRLDYETEDFVPWRDTIRRLTPVERERLQGSPDNFTKVPYRKKSAEACPDSPRYKAIGNSMAVPVMEWIFRRIHMVDELWI